MSTHAWIVDKTRLIREVGFLLQVFSSVRVPQLVVVHTALLLFRSSVLCAIMHYPKVILIITVQENCSQGTPDLALSQTLAASGVLQVSLLGFLMILMV
ncbi:hypothetical protein EDB85DRAFT_2021466 [Lactarius pseudohatsudake]|nr:hypothetical protein EDB85DRAFT_2021466 [Lactarius pseudohatsudake]